MLDLAIKSPGFLGFESARNDLGMRVSYWESLSAMHNWKINAVHKVA